MAKVALGRGLVFVAALAVSACNDNDGGQIILPPYDSPGSELCAQSPHDQLCSFLPHDVIVTLNDGYSQLGAEQQRPFDNFSWQSFLALNWPASRDGTPLDVSIGEDLAAPRVWQSYPTALEVFGVRLTDGTTARPAACENVGSDDQPIFHLIAKSDHIDREPGDILQATGQPLVDRNRNFVLYDVRVGPDEAAYILSNGLDTVGGQQMFMDSGQSVSFPLGFYTDPDARTGGSVGALEIKSAWRIMEPSDPIHRFFTLQARVYVPSSDTVDGSELCFTATLGLVSMHILHRTTSPTNFDQDWIWSTFEHVLNAPLATNAGDPTSFDPGPSTCTPPSSAAGQYYSFYDSRCTGAACTPNQPPQTIPPETDYLWDTTPPFARRYANDGRFGTQVVQCWKIYDETEDLNRVFRSHLSGTVWANYRLVNTQWQGGVEDPFTENGNIPRYLGNTAIETYIQPTSSCLECHANATTVVGQDANFSFLLGLASLAKE